MTPAIRGKDKSDPEETDLEIDPHKKYGYPNTSSHFDIDEFVYCYYTDSNGLPAEHFGRVTNYNSPNETYVIKLESGEGWLSAPLKSLRKAGQA